MGLDVLDLKALQATAKEAGHISFTYDHENHNGSITIRKDVLDNRDRYAGTVAVAEIGVSALIQNYGIDRCTQASYVLSSPRYTPEWVTIVQNLKLDDEITLEFTASNNSTRLEEAGLHQDELRVKVRRPRGNKSSLMFTYLLAIEVRAADGWRMVRP